MFVSVASLPFSALLGPSGVFWLCSVFFLLLFLFQMIARTNTEERGKAAALAVASLCSFLFCSLWLFLSLVLLCLVLFVLLVWFSLFCWFSVFCCGSFWSCFLCVVCLFLLLLQMIARQTQKKQEKEGEKLRAYCGIFWLILWKW